MFGGRIRWNHCTPSRRITRVRSSVFPAKKKPVQTEPSEQAGLDFAIDELLGSAY